MGDWETAVEESAGIVAALLKDVGKNVLNRPYGSEPVDTETQLTEWALLRDSPEGILQLADDQGWDDASMIRNTAALERAYQKWNK